MKRLAYIELENLRSWRGATRINLPERGLVALRGRNLDTGGGSGSGKSSVLLAVNYVFGECPYPATELKSWGVEGQVRAALGFTDGTSIDRGTRGLKLSGKVEGSMSQKEESIRTDFLSGLDVKTAQLITSRSQRRPGFFLSTLTDSGKKEFLTKILNLGKFEKACEESEGRAKKLEASLLAATAVRDSVARSLGALPEVDTSRTQVELADVGEQLLGFEGEMDSARQRLRAIEAEGDCEVAEVEKSFAAKLAAARAKVASAQKAEPLVVDRTELEKWDALVAQCQQRLARLRSEHQAKLRAREEAMAGLTARLGALTEAIGAIPGLRREQSAKQDEIDGMAADVCPTCQRDWDHAQEHRKRLEARVAEIQDALLFCEAAQEEAAALREEILATPQVEENPNVALIQKVKDDAVAKAATAQGAINSAQAVHSGQARAREAEARAELAVLSSEASAAAAAARDRKQKAAASVRTLIDADLFEVHRLQELRQELRYKLADAESVAKQRASLTAQLEEGEAKVSELDKQLAAEQDFQQLVGREGFLGSIFDEILAEIGDEANQLLASVANTRHCTIQFRSESLTQKGTVRREIKPVVSIGGFEAPMESGLSGGMYSVVELVVDLALSAVISRRSGVQFGWLVLDEVMDGLGPVEKESAMEILQRYAADRLVLVVDHSSEFQSSFSRSIDVEMSGGVSRLAGSL